jgi:integrase
MVILSLNTGLRQGELFSLCWENISQVPHPQLCVLGFRAKSGKTRYIPLNTTCQNILSEWKRQTGASHGPVFPNREGKAFNNVKRSWASLLKDAEIKAFRWHDMRHHFASSLAMKGIDLNTIRELLGHSDLKMTLRYSHLCKTHTLSAVERLTGDRQALSIAGRL